MVLGVLALLGAGYLGFRAVTAPKPQSPDDFKKTTETLKQKAEEGAQKAPEASTSKNKSTSVDPAAAKTAVYKFIQAANPPSGAANAATAKTFLAKSLRDSGTEPAKLLDVPKPQSFAVAEPTSNGTKVEVTFTPKSPGEPVIVVFRLTSEDGKVLISQITKK